MARKSKKSKSRTRRSRARRAARAVKRVVVKTVQKFRSKPMARKNRSKGRGSAIARSRGGFINKDVIAAVAGAAGAGIASPFVAKMLPATMSKGMRAIVQIVIGLVGYAAIRKFSSGAALGFAGVMAGGAVMSFVGKKGVAGLGNFDPDGVDYLPSPEMAGYMGEYDDEYDMAGMGEYDDSQLEFVNA